MSVYAPSLIPLLAIIFNCLPQSLSVSSQLSLSLASLNQEIHHVSYQQKRSILKVCRDLYTRFIPHHNSRYEQPPNWRLPLLPLPLRHLSVATAAWAICSGSLYAHLQTWRIHTTPLISTSPSKHNRNMKRSRPRWYRNNMPHHKPSRRAIPHRSISHLSNDTHPHRPMSVLLPYCPAKSLLRNRLMP